MDNCIYESYQGEDFDITFNARNSFLDPVDISNIDISVALVHTLQSKIFKLGEFDGITLTRNNSNSFTVSLNSIATSKFPSGDYFLSVMLTNNGKKAIEQIKIIRIINSLHK